MKYEYYSQGMNPSESKIYKEQLDVMGALGWELIHTMQIARPISGEVVSLHVFKRPLNESEESPKITPQSVQLDEGASKHRVRRKLRNRSKRVVAKLHKSRVPKVKKKLSRPKTNKARKRTKTVAPCAEHPKYTAQRKPRSKCPTCRKAYLAKHDSA
jgi:hypothetical protein